MTGLHIA